jgi:low affinity Fe/Cu permease
MKKRTFSERFIDIADWVSDFIGKPSNISFWLVLTVLYIALGPYFASHQLLPDWFISNNFNFPLNTVTTLMELFLGFLLAAAANRAQRKLEEILAMLVKIIKHILRETNEIDGLLKQNNNLTAEVNRKLDALLLMNGDKK